MPYETPQFAVTIEGPETTHLIEHGLDSNEIVLHLLHDKGYGIWDACLHARFDTLDSNTILLELRDPEYIHRAVIIG